MESVHFKDIAGYEDEKKAAMKVVKYLKNYKAIKEAGADLPKGMILYGEPGVGKTMMAKAIATEAGVPFVDVGLSSVSDSGGMIDRFKSSFEEAKSHKPSILFLDELDQLVGMSGMTDSDERRRLADYLLQTMDGSNSSKGVFVIATCNYVRSLPKSLLRSGRMDIAINFPMPDVKNREALFQHYLSVSEKFKNISAHELALHSENLECADIKSITNAVLLNCLMEGRDATKQDFETRIMPLLSKDIERKVPGPYNPAIAYHELSHYAVSYEYHRAVREINISRGRNGGYTAPASLMGGVNYVEALRTLRILLAGKAGEEFFSHQTSIGASMDLMDANAIFENLCRAGSFGFDYLPLAGMEDSNSSDAAASQRLAFRNSLFARLYKEDLEILRKREGLIKMIYPALMERGELSADELSAFEKAYENNAPAPKLKPVLVAPLPQDQWRNEKKHAKTEITGMIGDYLNQTGNSAGSVAPVAHSADPKEDR